MLYSEDAAVMCTGGGSGAQLTDESVRLWDKRSREYVKAEIAKIAPWLNTSSTPAGRTPPSSESRVLV
jgi:hypothetical protein